MTPFRRIKTRADLNEAVAGLGLPAVLKTADFGYDGKGQIKLTAADQLDAAWNGLRGAEGIYEAWVSFAQEISVVGARTLRGEFAAFPVFSNTHVDHILDLTIAPAPLETRLERQAVDL
ncbi:MAG TPA: ATP-grasp domain-containing protein, partial [Candidatus Dormibacteraeota bacterium]|nr:ATP-grasp domain-containing protein [Candidatus Dormibacteraeota bacterium]